MAVDANILQGIRPAQIADPLDSYAKISAIRNADTSNALQQYSLSAAQRADARANALQSLGRNLQPGENFADKLRANGFQDEALKFDTAQAGLAKDRAKAGADTASAAKSDWEVAHGKATSANDAVTGVLYAASMKPSTTKADIAAAIQAKVDAGEVPKQAAMAAIGMLPDDPTALKAALPTQVAMHMKVQDAMHQANEQRKMEIDVSNNAANNATSRANNAATNATAMAGHNLTHADALARIAAEGGKPPSGYAWGAPDANGQPTLRAISGGEHDPATKPLSEDQGKSAGYALKASEAFQQLEKLDQPGAARGVAVNSTLANVPVIGGVAAMGTRATQNANTHDVEQAQRNFINAVLRRESGASINAGEFENARLQYFVQPNDPPSTIANKRANMQQAVAGIEASAGAEGMKRARAAYAQQQTANPARPVAPQPAAPAFDPAALAKALQMYPPAGGQ